MNTNKRKSYMACHRTLSYSGKLMKITVVTMALASSSLFANSLLAQQESASSGGTLEEIVVTARKRAESLQDTPIAVTAFSAENLADRQIDGLGSLDNAIPNLVFNDGEAIGGSNAAASVFIRGIGQTDFNQNTEPGVGIYIDGVYVARSVGSALDLIDLQQIEVLRGPQGTLFGRNTIGGAISLTTQKPADEFGGYLSGKVGTDGLLQLKGTLNAPLSENILSKFTFFSKQRDGYVTREDGLDLGNDDVLGFRADFQYTASDSLIFDLALEKLRERENGVPVTAIELREDAPFAQFNNFALNGAECFVPLPSGAPGPTPASPNCFNEQFLTGNIRTTRGTGPSVSNLDIEGATLTATWAIGDVELKSISAYRELDSFFATDHDHSPLLVDHTSNDYVQDQFSQEFQLTGSSENYNWLVGLYYFEEQGTDVNDVDFPIGSLRSGGSVDNEATAAFGQLTYNFTDALSLTAGVRHTEEDKIFVPNQFYRTPFVTPGGVLPQGGPLVLPGAIGELNISETNILVNLAYEFSEQTMAYLSFSDGFKSGGFTQRLAGPPFTEPPAFQPEFVEVVELGLKTQFWNDRARLNMAIFNTQYDDIQLNVLAPGLPNPFTINAAEATLEGAEVELTALLTDNFEINASLGYLDSEFDSTSGGINLQTVVGPIPVGTGLVNTNSSFVNAPELTFSLGLAHDFALANGILTSRLDWFYRDEVFNDALNTPALFQESYDIINLGLTYRDGDGRWSIRLGITNLTDEEYLTSGFSDLGAVGFSEGIFARGRETSLEATWKF